MASFDMPSMERIIECFSLFKHDSNPKDGMAKYLYVSKGLEQSLNLY